MVATGATPLRGSRGAATAAPLLPRPFLKWAGGKTQLLPQLLARFPARFGRYHEPFVGAGAAFFALAPPRAVLSDINAELIATYTAVRDNVEDVITALAAHVNTEAHYYAVRAQCVTTLRAPARAARTIFLNRACYNGLYRVNSRGLFNVPWGRRPVVNICRAEALRAAARALRAVALCCSSAFAPPRRICRGDLVYFDPPYDPVSATSSFTAYAAAGFGREHQVRLAACFARLARRGVHVVLSNADTPFIRALYRDFHVTTVQARRAINSRADRRGPVGEVIVSATAPGSRRRAVTRPAQA